MGRGVILNISMFDEYEKTSTGIAYYSHGESREVAVMVHGSFGSAAMWGAYVQPLVDAGFRVLSLDLAGHGASDGDVGTVDMDGYVQNIVDVVEAEDVQPALLVGHSMSGLTVLMAAVQGVASQVVAMDPSPSAEVQGRKSTDGIPDRYDAYDAGMPAEPASARAAIPDMTPEMLMSLKGMLGSDSGPARRQRKAGISIPKDILDEIQVLFVGAELGDSLPFGITADQTKAMASFYDKPVHIVDGATHPGILMGVHGDSAAARIVKFATETRSK